jgi:hypothetical protein
MVSSSPENGLRVGQEQFHGIAGLLLRDMRSRASAKFRNQGPRGRKAIVQVNHFADCENAL